MPSSKNSKHVVDLRGKRPSHPDPAQGEMRFPNAKATGKTFVISPQRRVSPVRARRTRLRIALLFGFVILLGSAAYGVSWLSYQPRFQVSAVDITGTQVIPRDLVYDYVETQLYDGSHPFISRTNVLTFNAGALGREIKGFFPRIASVSVTRSSLLANAIQVAVTERASFALWCADDSHAECYQMDESGYVFATASNAISASGAASNPLASSTTASNAASNAAASSTSAAALPTSGEYVFEGGISTSTVGAHLLSPIGQTFVGAHLPGILAFLDLLKRSGYNPTGAIVVNDQDFYVPLYGSYYLKVSYGENPATLLDNLGLVLRSDPVESRVNQLEYVDLRFGDRVYYKFVGEDQSTASSSPSR